MKFQNLKGSIWRVPLIAVIAGFLYSPLYLGIVVRLGVIELGVIDDKVSVLTSGALLIATLVLGWIFLLRKQTRTDIFVSSSVVVVYGLLLFGLQFLTGSTTGPAAVAFLYLGKPLDWTIFPTELGFYVKEHAGFSIPFFGVVRFFVPWLFALFGKKSSESLSEQ